MKLNSKGFAITGIMYSVLILFLALLLGILAILNSRKVLLDKTKKELLDKFNEESVALAGGLADIQIINQDVWTSSAKTVNVTITAGEGPYTYTLTPTSSIDDNVTWNNATVDANGLFTFTANNGSYYLWIRNGNNEYIYINNNGIYRKKRYFTISKVDTTPPSLSLSVTNQTATSANVVANASDGESQIYRYQYSTNNGSSWSAIQTSNIFSISGNVDSTVNVKVRVYNNAYLNTPTSNTYREKSTSITFGYTTYATGTIVYYNPTMGTKCTDYANADRGLYASEDGCLRWYTFNDSASAATINLLLDHTMGRGPDFSFWLDSPRLLTANEVAQIAGINNFDPAIHTGYEVSTISMLVSGGGLSTSTSYWESPCYYRWEVAGSGEFYRACSSEEEFYYYGYKPVITVNKTVLQ